MQPESRPFSLHRRTRRAGAVLGGLALALCSHAPAPAAPLAERWTSGGPHGTVVVALAVDPLRAGTVYAGSSGHGVYKSTDRGVTWQAANAGMEDAYVESIAVDPAHPATLYAAAANRGVFVSTDAAQSWRPLNSGLPAPAAHHLALDAGASALYVATTDGVFRLAGGAWSPTALMTRTAPGGDVSLDAWIDCLAIEPASQTLYACYFSWSDETGGGWRLLKSPDAGATWNAVELPSAGGPVEIAIDSSSPTPRLYVATYEPLSLASEVLRSDNAGADWDRVGSDMPGCAADCRVRGLTIAAPAAILAATDHGVFATGAADSGWIALGSGIDTLEVNAVAVDAVDQRVAYAATAEGVFTLTQAAGCAGDCDGDGTVRIPDLITMVGVALGEMSMAACTAGDGGDDGAIGIDDIVSAVGRALAGCPDTAPIR